MADLNLDGAGRSGRPELRFRTRLEGTWYRFRLAFNQRNRSWYLDLEQADGTALVTGLRLVAGVDLLRPFRTSDAFPPGQLFVLDGAGLGRDPGLTSFRDDHRLVYREAATVAELAGTEFEVR